MQYKLYSLSVTLNYPEDSLVPEETKSHLSLTIGELMSMMEMYIERYNTTSCVFTVVISSEIKGTSLPSRHYQR
jgi:hypothetical protein